MKIEWDSNYDFSFQRNFPDKDPHQTLKLLSEKIKSLKINTNISLLGIPDAYPDGGICIHQEGEVWLVYHSEKGMRSRPAIFINSYDAANFYLWIHLSCRQEGISFMKEFPCLRCN